MLKKASTRRMVKGNYMSIGFISLGVAILELIEVLHRRTFSMSSILKTKVEKVGHKILQKVISNFADVFKLLNELRQILLENLV